MRVPLLFLLVALEVDLRQISSIVSDSGMDFKVPIRVVFQEILAKNKVEELVKLKKDSLAEEVVKAALPDQTPKSGGKQSKAKGKSLVKGTTSSASL
ncbi:hypothetical protein AMTR_s00055p00213850 [Amborella trichopoda]|uniref:FRIGIDA-like protein n=1 Tax=Amborella trichopoda TaxID=13333 RepID=U5D7C5_AMBTC|nr:hypothetical protein AMTR_s00055p00213850 [Amborella trichopoda]